MSRSAIVPLVVCGVLAAALAAAGCGGGGGGSGAGASLRGVVYERDGSGSNLQGIQIVLEETGETFTTGANGSFDCGSVPTGHLSLFVKDPAVAAVVRAEVEDDDDDELDEDEADELEDEGEEADEHHCHLSGVSDGETIVIRLDVEDGQIESCEVSRSEGDDDDREVELALELVDGCPDPEVSGEIEIEAELEDGALEAELEVEVEGFAPGETLGLFLVCGDTTDDLGTRIVDAEGEAEWEFETEEGGSLPGGHATLDELVGCVVEVRHEDGTVCLRVTIPALPPPSADDDEDDDDHESDDGDEEGEDD
jgi:hypothetical protein